jgi:hypothetical protein
MANIEKKAIRVVIDSIWEQYDFDRSGALDKNET